MPTVTLPMQEWGMPFVNPATLASRPIVGNTDGVGFLIQVPKSGTLTGIAFATAAAATPATINILAETVGADGMPSGTAYKGCVAAQKTSPAASTRYEVDFATPATDVVQGDFIAITFKCPSGSVNLNIATVSQNVSRVPRVTQQTSGTWAHSDGTPILCLKYSDGTWPYAQCFPAAAAASSGFNSESNPAEIGNQWTGPLHVSRVCTGMWALGDFDCAGTFGLYADGSDTALTSFTWDPDFRSSQNAAIERFTFPANVALSPGKVYRVTFKPSANTPNNTVHEYTVTTAASLESTAHGGMLRKCYRSAGGSWSTDTTKSLLMGPSFGGIVVPYGPSVKGV